jgi:hypothetical protein
VIHGGVISVVLSRVFPQMTAAAAESAPTSPGKPTNPNHKKPAKQQKGHSRNIVCTNSSCTFPVKGCTLLDICIQQSIHCSINYQLVSSNHG